MSRIGEEYDSVSLGYSFFIINNYTYATVNEFTCNKLMIKPNKKTITALDSQYYFFGRYHQMTLKYLYAFFEAGI